MHTHAVVVATPEGTMLWDTSCPRDWEERLKAVSNLSVNRPGIPGGSDS